MSPLRRAAGLLLCACISLFTHPVLASDHLNGAWATFYTSGAFHQDGEAGPWRYGLYSDARWYDRLEGVNQYVLQPGIGYRLDHRFSVWGGYTYFRSEVDGVVSANEHRAWQQLSWNVAHWRFATLKSRTRLEQRFRDGRDGTDLRLRQNVRIDARFRFNPRLVFILGNEYFHHLRDTEWTRQGYGQNRFYTGLGFDFRNVRMEALYMNQQYRVRQLPDLVNHLAVVNFRM